MNTDKNIQNSTAQKKSLKRTADNTIQKIKKSRIKGPRKKGSYIKKYEENFFFMTCPPNKKFFNKLAEDYLNWALELAEQIYSGELDPSKTWHPLTVEYFVVSNGFPLKTWDNWLNSQEAEELRKAHEQVITLLGNLREAAAMWNKGNAGHIAKTLAHYSKVYRQEQERLSALNNPEDTKGRLVIEVEKFEVRSGNTDQAQ